MTARRRAVVIGASGGIGGALVAGLAASDWSVDALSRSAAGRAEDGIVPGVIDIENEPSIAVAAQTVQAHGPVDLILVASGILRFGDAAPEKSYRALDAATLARYFAVNATGPALVARYFLPLLPRDRPATFAVLSARVGSIGDNRLGGWYGYRASKAALNMLVRTLAIELRRTHPQAICVALHPGTVDTALSAPFQKGMPPDKLFDPAFSAARLLDVLSGLEPAQSGGCFAWDGQPVEP